MGLALAGFGHDKPGTGIRRGRPQLSAGRHGGDQMQQMFDQTSRHIPLRCLPLLGRTAFDIRNQLRNVNDDIIVKDPAGQFGRVDMGGTGIVQVVDGREIIRLGLLGVDGKGVRHMDGRGNAGVGIAGNKASEHGGVKASAAFQRLKIFFVFFEPFARFFANIRGAAVGGGHFANDLGQKLDLRVSQHDQFAPFRAQLGVDARIQSVGIVFSSFLVFSGRFGALRTVKLALQRLRRGDDFLRIKTFLFDQRLLDFLGENPAGTDRCGDVLVHILQAPQPVGHAPVTFQALRTHAGPADAAKGDPLGKAGVVAVQQRSGIGRQRRDLDEAGQHCHSDSFSFTIDSPFSPAVFRDFHSAR